MDRKTKRDRVRRIVAGDSYIFADGEEGNNLRLSAFTKSGFQYVVTLSDLDAYQLVHMIENLSQRAAYLLRQERLRQQSLDRRMQEAARKIREATQGGA